MSGDRLQFENLMRQTKTDGPMSVAVVYPCDESSLLTCVEMVNYGLAKVAAIGPAARLRHMAERLGTCIGGLDLIDTEDDPERAATAAIAYAREQRLDAIMKGSIHTDELMHVVLRTASGMRSARRVSHAFVLQVPGWSKLLMLTDCVVNVDPDLLAKRDIVCNAIELAQALGVPTPRVAVLCATETVCPQMRASVDAAALCKMADRGQIARGVIEGPLAMDSIVFEESARMKGIDLAIGGRPDIVLMPNLEAGNALYKALVHVAGASCAGIVLGTRLPVILTSRADSIESRLASVALAATYLRRPLHATAMAT